MPVEPPSVGPLGRTGWIVAGLWTAVGIASAGLSYANWYREGLPITLGQTLATQVPAWVFWSAVTVPILALGRRYPPVGVGWPRRAMLHLAVSIPVHGGATYVYSLAFALFWPLPNTRPLTVGAIFPGSMLSRWPWNLLIYGSILAVGTVLDASTRLREREGTAAKLRYDLAQARLRALRMQLQPHFLYNTLHTISALIDEHPLEARRTLALLGDLLRTVLREEDRADLRLREELEFLRRYLDIERLRIGPRLTVTFEVQPGLAEASVPCFILQPLVENAIRYGIAPRATPGRITIAATRDHRDLVLAVRDDGPGFPEDIALGVGLATTRDRLATQFGRRDLLQLRTLGQRGAEALVRLPGVLADVDA